jgi:hypothetical protein
MPTHPVGTELAPGVARRPQLAYPRDHAHALVAGLVQDAPPAEFQHLLDTVSAGHGLFLYLPPDTYEFNLVSRITTACSAFSWVGPHTDHGEQFRMRGGPCVNL